VSAGRPKDAAPVLSAQDAALSLDLVDSAAIRGYVARTGDRSPRTRTAWAELAMAERTRPIAQE